MRSKTGVPGGSWEEYFISSCGNSSGAGVGVGAGIGAGVGAGVGAGPVQAVIKGSITNVRIKQILQNSMIKLFDFNLISSLFLVRFLLHEL